MSEYRLIVGLGNPGKDYEYTRHNLGFLMVQFLAEQLAIRFKLSSFTNGLTAEGTFEGQEVGFLLPLTYMNNSGIALHQVCEKKNVPLKNILVICDDFNLDFGHLRIRAKGSDGGHNGLASIIQHLNDNSFARLRLGVGPISEEFKNSQNKKDNVIDFVLGEFTKKEKKQLDSFIQEGSDCCKVWLKDGVQKAMQEYNSR